MKKFKKNVVLITLIAAFVVAVTACGTGVDSNKAVSSGTKDIAKTEAPASTAAADSKSSVTKIQVGYSLGGYPTEYVDDKGTLTGYDIETLRLVNGLLPEYEFVYTGLDQTAVYAGLSTGKFQVALSNAFWTPERASKYLFPKENIGASILGFFTRKEFSDVKSLSDAAAKKMKIVPILAGDGQYYVVKDYNDTHKDAQITLTPTDDANAFTESFDWVLKGRYDFSLLPLQYWNGLVVAKDGAFHKYDGQFTYTTFGAVKTWAILAKGQEEFAAKLDTALAKLKSEGKLVELSKKFYGYDNFANLPKDAK